jgi:pre-mRNA-splicing factor ATP-dependent RNA helicase DHX15/PRP43
VGLPLAELPLEPQLGAALLAACTRFGCCQELLTIAGMLSVPSVWAAAGELCPAPIAIYNFTWTCMYD